MPSLLSREEDEHCAPLLLGPALVLRLELVQLLDDLPAHLHVLLGVIHIGRSQ